ncbi:MAG TPA: YggT family protein [Burkholderiales bacterium]|nr:YggT family protein [Burkholderiales bacterium]
MFAQIGVFLVDAVFSFVVFVLLARFHFQWLRVPFRNPVGEFVLATTNWLVVPARRVVPGLAGLDLATLLLGFVVQALGLWAQAAIVGAEPGPGTLAAIAAVDLLRYSLYILVFAVIVQAVLSWVNPYTPLAPAFDTITRPFLRPLRRFVPPVGNVDLTPLILLLVLYVALIVVNHLRVVAAATV